MNKGRERKQARGESGMRDREIEIKRDGNRSGEEAKREEAERKR